jgi:hypothetical protein
MDIFRKALTGRWIIPHLALLVHVTRLPTFSYLAQPHTPSPSSPLSHACSSTTMIHYLSESGGDLSRIFTLCPAFHRLPPPQYLFDGPSKCTQRGGEAKPPVTRSPHAAVALRAVAMRVRSHAHRTSTHARTCSRTRTHGSITIRRLASHWVNIVHLSEASSIHPMRRVRPSDRAGPAGSPTRRRQPGPPPPLSN